MKGFEKGKKERKENNSPIPPSKRKGERNFKISKTESPKSWVAASSPSPSNQRKENQAGKTSLTRLRVKSTR